MAATGIIEQFLESAKRRHLLNLALEYLAVAAAFGAGGTILLLILGTQIFNWYWPVALFAIALAVGLMRAYKRRLSEYRLAQVVDAQLGLHDRISTLVFFRSLGQNPATLRTVEEQAAEHLEQNAVRSAVPLTFPRYGYASIALVAAAAGLVGVRYGVLRTLDFSAPIARIDFSAFDQPANVQAASKKSAIQERFEEQLRQLGLNVEDNNGAEDRALSPDATNVQAVAEPGGNMKAPEGKQISTPQAQQDQEGGEAGEKSQGDGTDAAADGSSNDGKQAGKTPQSPPKDPKNGSPGSQDSLMNKMKDALANLMNKLKMPQKSEQQSASTNQGSAPNGKQQAGDKGMQSRSKSNGEGQPSPDQQGDQEGQGEKMASDQSRAGDRNSEKPGNQDSKTGMGRQDGQKDIKDAEQLAAMGKISEIFGKRAQQITGEMTVEVSSSRQTLKTAYTSRTASHSDTGGEVNRDEIPLAYQGYIQRYFEEVRKSPAKPKNP